MFWCLDARVTPVLIPNTEVKPCSADDTLTGKVGRRQNRVLNGFFVIQKCYNSTMSHVENWQFGIEPPITSRGKENYFKNLDISPEFLHGKKILDIGSGMNVFAEEVKDYDLDLVSMDPFYALSQEQQKGHIKENTKFENKGYSQLVAGKGEALPFADGTFDVILALMSLPYWSNNFDSVKNFFYEITRVLKSKGEARISPSSIGGCPIDVILDGKLDHLDDGTSGEYLKRSLENLFDELRGKGCTIDFKTLNGNEHSKSYSKLLIISKD